MDRHDKSVAFARPSAHISDEWTRSKQKFIICAATAGSCQMIIHCVTCVAVYQYRQQCCHVPGTVRLTTIPNISSHARLTYAIMIINANRFVFGAASHDAALLATRYRRRRSLSVLDAGQELIGCHMTITFHSRTLYFHNTLRRDYSWTHTAGRP